MRSEAALTPGRPSGSLGYFGDLSWPYQPWTLDNWRFHANRLGSFDFSTSGPSPDMSGQVRTIMEEENWNYSDPRVVGIWPILIYPKYGWLRRCTDARGVGGCETTPRAAYFFTGFRREISDLTSPWNGAKSGTKTLDTEMSLVLSLIFIISCRNFMMKVSAWHWVFFYRALEFWVYPDLSGHVRTGSGLTISPPTAIKTFLVSQNHCFRA